jgi:hypothetical protein
MRSDECDTAMPKLEPVEALREVRCIRVEREVIA